ncbi:MAG: RING-HC finger protein [Candidatus Endonucleobacter bathymodioli]|uniref:RING-HC finger protein n=1 Tax=Candidatus Endonucleibacter bathymodioli TaxID=539814 RepID=A0AA90STH5_9GAMM|nr:RING-HC finger protein [Candidatus Endonucleobacter bathymodioli]
MAINKTDDSSLRTFFLLAMSRINSPESLSEIIFFGNKENLRTYRYILNGPPGGPHFSENQITELHPLSHCVSDVVSKSKNDSLSGHYLESGDGQLEWDVPVESNAEFTFSVIYDDDDDSSFAAPILQQDADTKQVTRKQISLSPEAGGIIITPSGNTKQVWQWRLLLTGKGTATIITPTGGCCIPALSGWHNHDTQLPNACGQTVLRFPAKNKKQGSIERELACTLSRIMQPEENKKITMYQQELTKEQTLRTQLNTALPWLKVNFGQDFLSKSLYRRPIIPPSGQHFCVFPNTTMSCEAPAKPSSEQPLLHDYMKREFNRLGSFSSFPYNLEERLHGVSFITLSRAGFYYTGSTSECKCFCCGHTYKDWKRGDDPYDIHNQISPNCAYMTGEDSGNIPIHTDNRRRPHRTEFSYTSSSNITLPMQQLRITESHSEASITDDTDDSATETILIRNSDNLTTGAEHSQNNSASQGGFSEGNPERPDYADIATRKISLRSFPSHVNISTNDIAEAGFFFVGYEDYVRCFYCGKGLRNWRSTDDPFVVHAQWYPSCAYIKAYFEGRTKRQEQQNTVPETGDQQSSNTSANPPEAATPHITPINAALLPLQEPNITESSRPSANTAHSSGHHNIGSAASNNSTTAHNDSENINFNDIGINIDTPKHPMYAVSVTRSVTYQNWLAYEDQDPAELVKEGFFYTKENDSVCCFFCGLMLNDWKADDIPRKRHADMSPQCWFLQSNNHEHASNMRQRAIEQSLCATDAPEQAKNNEQLCKLIDEGVEFIISYKFLEASNPILKAAAIRLKNNLYNRQDLDKHIAVLQTIPGTYMNAMISIIQAEREVINDLQYDGFNVALINTAIEHFNNEIPPLTKEVTITTKQITNIISKIKEGGMQISSATCNGARPKEVSKEMLHMAQEYDALTEENDQLKEMHICKICRENESSLAFLPCGHKCCCPDCAPAMKKCPLCKRYIRGTVKIYLY